MVSSYVSISPMLDGEEEDTLLSNVAELAAGDEELEAIMKLGEHLATGNQFSVQDVGFNHDLQEGYLGAFFQCATGACQFDMHLTIAKWDVMSWLQIATFGYHAGVDWNALDACLNEWCNTWVPTLRSLHLVDIEVLIGTRTSEQQWRVIMKPKRNSKLFKDIRAMKSKVENDLSLGTYNRYSSPHLSLDRWAGVLP